jgi:hypothetical protein
MYEQRLYLRNEARLFANQPVIFPEDPEPEWLRRKAAIKRRLDEIKADESRVREAPKRAKLAWLASRRA